MAPNAKLQTNWHIFRDSQDKSVEANTSFTKFTIKRHAKMQRFLDGLETFRIFWIFSKWPGNFPNGLETFWMVWKLFGWSENFLDGLETFWMVLKL